MKKQLVLLLVAFVLASCTLSPSTASTPTNKTESLNTGTQAQLTQATTPLETETPIATLAATQTLLPTPTEIPSPSSIKSNQLRELASQMPKEGTADIYGFLRYNESPVTLITSKQPKIWITNDDTSRVESFNIKYDDSTGEYLVLDVPAGKYAVSSSIVLSSQFPQPGDYFGYQDQIKVNPADQTFIQANIDLDRVIHLASPFDNSKIYSNYNLYSEFDVKDLKFEWDTIPGAVDYRIMVNDYQLNPYEFESTIISTDTVNSSYQPVLPTSEKGHFYGLVIFAVNSKGTELGQIFIRYPNGSYGWNYRFRVK